MKTVLLQLAFALASIFITGFFTLDATFASNIGTAIVLVLLHLAGLFWSRRASAPWRTYFLTAAGLIFYSSVLIIFQVFRFWHYPPFFAFLGFTLGFWGRKIRYPALIGWIIFSVYYSFIGYPQLALTYNRAPSPSSNETEVLHLSHIRLLDSLRVDQSPELEGRLILLETWNQYCGSCFQAMRDLHPFLQEMEASYPGFSHYYVYEGRRIPGGDTIGTIFRNDHLPYPDQQILWDPERALLELPHATGLPQFIFVDSALNVIHFSEGYRPRFRFGYKQRFRRVIERYGS